MSHRGFTASPTLQSTTSTTIRGTAVDFCRRSTPSQTEPTTYHEVSVMTSKFNDKGCSVILFPDDLNRQKVKFKHGQDLVETGLTLLGIFGAGKPFEPLTFFHFS